MKFAIVVEIAVVALAGALLFSTGVQAEPTARACWAMAKTVKTALDSHPDAQSAWDEYRTGTEACSRGYASLGMAHLQKAMNELGG